jgi:hypothetical protein
MLGAGCRTLVAYEDETPPAVPAGVYSTTGDGYVELAWGAVRTGDLAGYLVYRSRSANGTYYLLDDCGENYYFDADVANGITYFYAVSAYDRAGNESELSYETVHDTPRPEGRYLFVFDEDERAGVDFSGYYDHMVVPWDDVRADLFLLWHDGRYAMASTDIQIDDYVYGTDIQYAGYVNSLDEIDWAPEGGWSVESADTVSLYEGHGYLVWTWDNHFAKFRVTRIGDDYVVLDWAFQSDPGNPELLTVPVEAGAGFDALPKAESASLAARADIVRSSRVGGLAPILHRQERRR